MEGKIAYLDQRDGLDAFSNLAFHLLQRLTEN
jgi:hypothetical protein